MTERMGFPLEPNQLIRITFTATTHQNGSGLVARFSHDEQSGGGAVLLHHGRLTPFAQAAEITLLETLKIAEPTGQLAIVSGNHYRCSVSPNELHDEDRAPTLLYRLGDGRWACEACDRRGIRWDRDASRTGDVADYVTRVDEVIRP